MSKSTHDRGPTPYFHGRRDVLHDFGQQLTGAEDSRDGTIFLIQGAPGSGKTALLYECSKLARKHHWQVAEIHPDALWSTASLMRSLGRGGEYQISERIGTVDAVVVKGEYTSVPVPRTTISILQEMWYPLLLVLDEAQTLGASSRPSPEQSIHATNTLKEIHNGGLGRPVMLLAAGLGTTLSAFASLGISRFSDGCLIELGALRKESERAVINDWLTKKGGTKEDPTAWIDAIVQETNQWPRHVHSYARYAGEYLEKNNGVMTPQGLKTVMELGQKGRKQYYKQRLVDFEGDELICLYESIAGVKSGEPFSKDLIFTPLRDKYGLKEAKKVFKKLIDKGIIALVGGPYSVPIPSMHDWMKEELERIRETLR